MRALGTDPVQKLVTPRMFAMTLMLPLLTIVADFVGMLGGWVVSMGLIGTTSAMYWTGVADILTYADVMQGLIKPFFNGLVISLVGCFYGINTSGGTQGVGRATTQAVVVSSVWIFIINLFLTQIFVNL